MGQIRLPAVAAHFGRDLDFDLQRIATLIDDARSSGAGLLVLPDAALGGYLADLRHPDPQALPPALKPDDPLILQVARLAADMVVCLGYCEDGGDERYNSAVCVSGDGALVRHPHPH